jgi:ABC-type uncharacterized transport system substrate-binding protein
MRFNQLRRREFITLAGAAAWSFATRAQQPEREIVELRPDLILTQNTPTTAAMLQQTRSIPIIFATGSDPVGSGFVASFVRPGGNVTGFIDMEASLAGARRARTQAGG